MSPPRSAFGTVCPVVAAALRGLAGLVLSLSMLAAVSPARASDEAFEAGATAWRGGRFEEAVASFEAALASFERSLGERDPKTLAARSRLAGTYNELGRFTDALPLYEQVYQVRRELAGEADPQTLRALSDVSITLASLGRYGERLAIDERVLQMRLQTLGERHEDTLRSLSDIAVNYKQLGRQDEYLALMLRLVQWRQELNGERHPETLRAMNSLVNARLLMNQSVEALALIEKVVALRTEVLGEKHPNTLNSMSTMAIALGNVGRLAECLQVNEKVLRLRQETLGEQHPATWVSMANLAMVESELGRHEDAIARIRQALERRARTFGELHHDTLRARFFLALAHMQAGQPAEAAALSERYVEGGEQQRGQPGLSPENRQALFQAYANTYRLFATAHGQVGDTARGFHLAELSKARTLLESMSALQARRSGVLPAAEVEALEEMDRQVAALTQLIARSREVEVRQPLEIQRNELHRRHAARQQALKAQYPKFAQFSDVRILGLQDLPGLIPQDAVAMSYVVSQSHLGAFVVEPDGQARFVSLGSATNLAEAVDLWRRHIGRERRQPMLPGEEGFRAWRLRDGSYRMLPLTAVAPDGAREVQDLAEVGRYLGRLLLEPLAGLLRDRPRWIVSPDGPLALLPFETLPFGADQRAALEAAEIHYTQSLSVFALSRDLQKRYESFSERRSLVAMGAANYERASGPGPAAREGRDRARRVAPQQAEQLRDLDGLWQNLPGTEAEVKAVARLFPGSADTYLGEQATEQQLQALNARGALKNYRYLLLSAHGYLSAEQPALSSVVLGLHDRTPEADGYVTAAEWPAYDLRSELAVLSACDSGVGKVVSGEGVMGLPFAMFVAGNVNTILSLWPVDDKATAEFVTRLFEHLQAGQGAAQALASTKREFARHRRYSHPAYWAPFVLVGAG